MTNIKRLRYLLLTLLISCSDDDEKFTALIDDDIQDNTAWQYVSTANHTGALDTHAYSSPERSLKITALDTQADGFSFWTQQLTTMDFPSGAKVVLKVKVKTEDVMGDGVFIAVRCDSDTGTNAFESTQGETAIDGSRDFKEYTVEINSIPKGTTNMWVFLIMSGTATGTAYFDDVSLGYWQ
ncbi:MAG: hypothetical protein QM762_11425 [Chryseolinea sp.]